MSERPTTPPATVPTKRRTLRRSLILTFAFVSLLSVVLLGALNYYQARNLLTDSVSDQLVNQQAAKTLAIRNGIDRLEQTVVIAAQSRGIVESLNEFSDAYGQLAQSDPLGPEEQQQLDEFYAAVQATVADLGLEELAPQDLQPGSDAGRYLQYHYIVENSGEQSSDLVTAPGDDSQYGTVHTERHPALLELRSQLGFGDLLLVDSSGNVVYSTNKRLDFATNAETGPYRSTGMGRAVTGRVAAAPVGDAVFVDFELYLPAAGKPSLFVAVAVRDDARTIGTFLAEIPIEGLNNLTVGNRDWEEAGLGTTGEIYVVGRDFLMRTDSRLWLEDPEEYLRKLEAESYDPPVGQLVQTFGSTILLQPVETEAAVVATDGEQFLGRTKNYLGRSSLTSAGPVGSDQVDWIVIAEVSSAEANDPLQSYLTRILIAGAILVPIVILLALAFADRMTRPVRPVVEAAGAVAAGDLEIEVADLGRNEFGDVGRRLNLLTAALRDEEEALAAEEEETKQLLLSALPTRLVTALRSGQGGLLDLVDTATVVTFDVDGMLEEAGIDEEAGVELSAAFSAAVESIADLLGIERVRSSTNQHVFAAGLGTPEPATEDAADFVLRVVAAITDFAEEHGIGLTYRAGLSTGDVIAGLLRSDQLTYGVFGDPPRTALALAGVAGPNQILVDAAVAAELRNGWILSVDHDVVDLRGEQMVAEVLEGRREATTDVSS